MAADPLQGRCPACGAEELYRAFQGHIACGNTLCQRQGAVDSLLNDPELTEHLVKITEFRRHDPASQELIRDRVWTLRHPLIERIDDDLFSCELAQYLDLMRQSNQYLPPGVHRVTVLDTGGWAFSKVER